MKGSLSKNRGNSDYLSRLTGQSRVKLNEVCAQCKQASLRAAGKNRIVEFCKRIAQSRQQYKLRILALEIKPLRVRSAKDCGRQRSSFTPRCVYFFFYIFQPQMMARQPQLSAGGLDWCTALSLVEGEGIYDLFGTNLTASPITSLRPGHQATSLLLEPISK